MSKVNKQEVPNVKSRFFQWASSRLSFMLNKDIVLAKGKP